MCRDQKARIPKAMKNKSYREEHVLAGEKYGYVNNTASCLFYFCRLWYFMQTLTF